MLDKIIIIGYGLFLLLGAYFGGKAGSSKSVITSLASAALVFLGFFLTMTPNPRNGFLLLSGIGVVLTVVFVLRVMATHKFMPAGMLLVITLGFLIFCLTRIPKT